MALSVFDVFKIGIGPSSSHTMGPMKASVLFISDLKARNVFAQVASIKVDLFGSLALTGAGHCSDKAIVLGLQGETAEAIAADEIDPMYNTVLRDKKLFLNKEKYIPFETKKHLKFHFTKSLPFHPNGLTYTALDQDESVLCSCTYYSVGGGHVVTEEQAKGDKITEDTVQLPLSYSSANHLLELCRKNSITIAELMMINEKTWRSTKDIETRLDHIWKVMGECIDRGCARDGILPGRLKVKRRAAGLFQQLTQQKGASLSDDPLNVLDWVNLYALAVNEENACGSKVVTAPTNGAAGIMPAVLRYYERFCQGADAAGIRRFLLTSGAIAILYTENASISGAEVGCQGEVGVACSMAAGGLVAALGGDTLRIEQAAEIGMEHNLGLTCDPIGGLVQIPCIERNAMGAVKAINAARIALRGDGHHYVSLDSVIKTMRQTGADMKSIYKETSRGGLAVNVIEC